MRIILSPAKKMNVDTDALAPVGTPVFMENTVQIAEWLQSQQVSDLKKLWNCNDKILEQNVERLKYLNLHNNLTPAILSYEGIAFQYMAPAVMETEQLTYLQEHLRILSAFYGVLKPMDGVTPYRLEMQAKASISGTANLYEYWGDRLYQEVRDESGVIINLASKEYFKCIEKYLRSDDRFISITFCEKSEDKLVTKGTYAKMARGEMVRYMAEHHIEDIEEIKSFDRLGFVYRKELSLNTQFVFLKKTGGLKDQHLYLHGAGH